MKSGCTFQTLIAPVSTSEFFASYWEKSFLHVRRNAPGTFDDLFSLDDVDRWLASTRTGEHNSVVITAQEGSDKGAERYRPRDVTLDRVYDAFTSGHSVVLNQLEDSWPSLSPLVKEMGKSFCADIGVNAYLTPRGSQAFPIHTDSQDAFILQVYGEKIWRLHELVELSAVRLRHEQDLVAPPSFKKPDIHTPLLAEIRLQPGDVLYIPRGMPHYAIAREETSLHLTVGVTPYCWMDFLKAALEQSTLRVPELRRFLPAGFVEDGSRDEAMRVEFQSLLQAFQESASFDETLQVLRRSRIRGQGFPLDGHFTQLARLPELSSGSEIVQREGLLCTIESRGDASSIRFGSRNVRGPAHLRPALEFIRDHARFRVDEVPGLDEQSRLVLVRRLIREGLLRMAEPRAETAEELRQVGMG